MTNLIKRFIKFKTGEELNENRDFNEYGLSEFDIVELSFLVEDKFGVDLKDLNLDKFMTLKEYANFVMERNGTNVES